MHPVLSISHAVISAALDRPVGNAHAQWQTRQSVIVTLEDASGQRGRGEAAPLPGLSPESLEDVRDALSGLGNHLAPSELALHTLPPSLRFALESALLELRAAERPAYAALLDSTALTRVPEHLELQVLLDDLETALPRAREAHALGARTFKVKLGRDGQAPEEAALLAQLRALGHDVTIRADANGQLGDTQTLAPALAQSRTEYLEDPLVLDDNSLARWVGVPLALDAPLAREPHHALRVASAHGARVVVLKPTLLGLEASLQLAARARSRGLRVVLSHCLEGPVGLAALAHLALAASASCHRALWGAQGLAPWPGAECFVDGAGRPLALPYYLGAARLLRPSSAGFGLTP